MKSAEISKKGNEYVAHFSGDLSKLYRGITYSILELNEIVWRTNPSPDAFGNIGERYQSGPHIIQFREEVIKNELVTTADMKIPERFLNPVIDELKKRKFEIKLQGASIEDRIT
jgi:hypothetical protein